MSNEEIFRTTSFIKVSLPGLFLSWVSLKRSKCPCGTDCPVRDLFCPECPDRRVHPREIHNMVLKRYIDYLHTKENYLQKTKYLKEW